MVRNAAWRRSLLCVLALSLGFASPPCKARIYTNHWAVRIAGGPEVAERIAEKYGYRNMGQIGDLKDHYHFFHSRTIKRSTLSSRGRHSFISMEPKVEWIQQQVVKRRIKRDYKPSPPLSLSSPAHSSLAQNNIFYNDAKWSSMWYIHCNDDVHNCQSDMNIMGAWKRGYTGKDVVDPQASFDVNGNDMDPMPRYDATNENKHGTRCAGEVAAAANNSHCIGRKGRGSIFVWASGNGGRSRDHCSCDGYTNSIYTISISSTAESGRKPWYLEECSSTLTTTYSSGENYDRKIITTDLRHRCTDSHTGTSASAPMAAAIIALALEANPLLTWRDVQHIIVKTSRAGHLSAPDWKTNAAGYNVSHLYGFGLMDAEAMVKEAERWRQVPTQHVCVENADRQIRTIRPEHVVRSVYKATGCNDNPNHHVIYLEHVVVRITITHPRRGDLSINLTSPSGTKSQLLANRLFDHSMEGFKNWEFMTTHCWGEKAAGDWVLEIYDSPSQLRSQKVPGKLKEWSLVLYGTSVHPYSSPPLRNERTRSTDMLTPTDEEFTEEYNGPCDSECNENGCEGPGPHHCINCLHYFLKFKNNTRMCVSECPSGFFRDDRKRCKKCSSSCETCVGSRSDQCTTCRTGFHLSEGSNTCVANCADSFYLDHDSNICRRCPENCKSCNASNLCTECKPGMSLQGNKCQMTCDVGTYYNGHRRNCEPCHRACATCAGTGIEACTKCAEGYLLEDWRCVSTCSTGYYLSEQTSDNGQVQRSCKKCDHSCYECLGPGERNCSSCVSGYNLEAGACVVSTICKDGQYLSKHGTCHLCDATCQQCTGPESEDCTSCPESRFFDEGRCTILCPTGRFAKGKQCYHCHYTCHKCTDEGPDNCSSCNQDKFDVVRYLFKGQCREVCPEGFFHSRHQCEPCAAQCTTCTAADHCLHCNSGYEIRNGRCVPLKCSPGQVAESKKEGCLHCDEGCEQCKLKDSGEQDQKTVCLKCEEDGECVDSCKEGFFVDKENQECKGECEMCHPYCKTCSGAGKQHCLSCGSGRFLTALGTCVSHCPSGTFANKVSSQCEGCSQGCVLCQDTKQCHHCRSELYLQNGVCVLDCERGFPQDGKCEPCAPECTSCTETPSHCLSCEGQHLLLNNSCRLHCPEGYYTAEAKCYRCPAHCNECNQEGLCKKCSDYYFLHKDECVEDCPKGYFADKKQQECVRCHDDCATCDGLGFDDCEVCRNQKAVRHNGECLAECPENMYYVRSTNECGDCDESCLTCSGHEPSSCLSCGPNRRKDANGHCVWSRQCSLNSYLDQNGDCHQCHKVCGHCSGPGKDDCLNCSKPLFLLNNTCVQKCPVGYFAKDIHERVCERCHFSCGSCVGRHSVQCVTCKPGFFWQGISCVEACSEGHFGNKNTMVCERCDPSCSKGATACKSCYDGFTFMGGICNSKCLVGFYSALQASGSQSDELNCKPCDSSCLSCKDECIMGVNFVFGEAKDLEAQGSTAKFFTTVYVFLAISVGGAIFLFLNARSKSLAIAPKTKAGGYEKLDTNEGVTSEPNTTFSDYSDRIIECEDEEEDDDIVIVMGKDGTVYHKLKCGLLEDDEIELEYDDESYSYR
ncbi:hypothetical protein INR49_015521 [Caranx melampygus]|nr:hypothetical protein INR49_015521 [Caranx melampygus]